jgi:hypothetical protein
MVQPAATMVTVEPLTVHTPVVSELNVTGLPERHLSRSRQRRIAEGLVRERAERDRLRGLRDVERYGTGAAGAERIARLVRGNHADPTPVIVTRLPDFVPTGRGGKSQPDCRNAARCAHGKRRIAEVLSASGPKVMV